MLSAKWRSAATQTAIERTGSAHFSGYNFAISLVRRGRMIRIVQAMVLLAVMLMGAAMASDPPPGTVGTEAPGQTPKVKPSHPSRIGLVLGGGGARGAAHIGVLKVLERERIPIAYISGTSMGSIIGALYAMGYSPDEMEGIITAINWKDMLEDDPSRIDQPLRRKDDSLRYLLGFKLGVRNGQVQLPRGAIQGQKLLLLLRRLSLPVWDKQDFDDFPIPFRCVGTDIAKGEAVIFDQGDVAVAIRASMSVPAAFAPIRVNGRLMVDGGIVNNVPYDVVKDLGATDVIAVDVGSELLGDKDLNSPIAITLQMINAVTQKLTDQILAKMQPTDVLIKPTLGDISSAGFDRATEAIPLGEAAAEEMVQKLRRFSVSEAEYAAWQQSIRRRNFDPPLVAFVDTVNKRSQSAGYVDRLVADQAGKPLDVDTLEKNLGEAYGAGPYERISWQLKTNKDGAVGIEVVPVDKGWGPGFLAFGLQLSDDFNGRSDYQLTAEFTQTGMNAAGREWRSLLGIGRNAILRSELYEPLGDTGQFYVQPFFDYRAQQQPVRVDNVVLAEYRVQRARIGVDLGFEPNANNRFFVGLGRGHDDADLQVGEPENFTDLNGPVGTVRLGFTHDSLDSANFPSAGMRVDLRSELYRTQLGSASNTDVLRGNADWALSWRAHRLLLGVRGSTFYGANDFRANNGFLGGFLNLSGFGERELINTHSLLGRAVYYRRMTAEDRLFSLPLYVGASFEAGGVYSARDELNAQSLIFAGSVFAGVDTFFGPIFLGFGRNDVDSHSWYLTFGSLLRPNLQ